MARDILSLLILVVMVPLAHEYQMPKDTPITYEGQIPPPSPLSRNPPIPTSASHYLGSHQQIDPCARDEVLVRGACHRLLTRGPCAPDEYVLLDPADHKGFCAARLCAPDRIFVFSDQLCHDPLNSMMCPPGRQLYQTAYGTPLCQCPDGTYEADDDLDDDVCQPLLSESLTCPPGQVLWFRDFSRPPECLADPCGGKNLHRGPNDLPFVPSAQDNKCYQLGQTRGVCPAQTWYSLALHTLRGVCVSLEDAGFQVFDEATMYYLTQQYGSFISRETVAPSPSPAPAPTTASAPAPAPAPAPDSSPTPALAQQTPGLSHTHLEQPQVFTGSQAAPGRTEPPGYEPESGTTNQANTQNIMFLGQQKPEDQRFTGLEAYGQEYIGLGEFAGQKSPGQARAHQDDAGLAAHPHTSQISAGDQEPHTRDFHGDEKGTAHPQETLDQPGASTVTLDDDASIRRSSDQGVTQPTDKPFREGSHDHSSHVTSKTSHLQSPPTHYSIPHETNAQFPHIFPSHSQQMHPQASPAPSSPTHYIPNQPPQSSTSLPFSAHSPPALHSHPEPRPHSSLSPASPTHYSPHQSQISPKSPGHPHDSQQSTYHSQAAFANHRPPQASPGLNHRLSPHSPTLATSHSSYFTPVSLEDQQLPLEVFGVPGGGVVENQQFTHSGNVPPRGSPGSHVPFGSFSTMGGSSLTDGNQGSFSRSATWGQNQGQPHLLHPQQQQQQHRGRRSTLPHASPGNVIEPLLAACRAGAQRDVNAKCREIVLATKAQTRREVTGLPPVPPRPSCPEGQAYGNRRECVPTNEAIDSINAHNLGCPASCLPPPSTPLPHATRRLVYLFFH